MVRLMIGTGGLPASRAVWRWTKWMAVRRLTYWNYVSLLRKA